MISDEKKLTLELYKEVGLETRQLNLETYTTSRLMLPPLIIGLLVLYGNVEKFLGVEFQNAEVVHWLVWLGCVLISLIWICNVSRLAQLAHLNRETLRECEKKLGLKGHKKIAEMDEKSTVSKVLRHSTLRFIGFGIYFSLLLNFLLKSISSYKALIPGIAIAGGVGLSVWVWYFYLKMPFRSSKQTPVKWGHIASIVLLIFFTLLILSVMALFYLYLQGQPDAKDHLISGLDFSEKGDYDNAIEAYTKAITIKRDYAIAYALRGLEYAAKGDDDRSNADLAKANALRKTQ